MLRSSCDVLLAGNGLIFATTTTTLSVLSFRYPFHPCVTTVARKGSRSLYQKCRWQLTTNHTGTLRMWLCTKRRDVVHGCMVCTERAETATVSRGTSHVTTYTTSVDIKTRCKNQQSLIYNHMRHDCGESARERRTAQYKSDDHHSVWLCEPVWPSGKALGW